MAKKEIITADPSAAQAKKNAAYFKKLMTGMHMGKEHGSVREAEYKGHHIVIETCYEITIDGKPFEGMLGVTNSGDVHYHGIPNMAFPSARRKRPVTGTPSTDFRTMSPRSTSAPFAPASADDDAPAKPMRDAATA